MYLIEKYLGEGFDWDEYQKIKSSIINDKNIKINWVDLYPKGKKAIMGEVKAAKENLKRIKNLKGNNITLYMF